MRFVRLSVSHFGCVEQADVELGPGLNVLYGPNDLGKSTLAQALRAVLLLQHTSTAADAKAFVPWHSGHLPTVSLVFTDHDGRFFRVTKTWDAGSRGQATLERSNDGRVFSPAERGRAVDGALRKMLGWGVSEAGGRGGPKGLPKTFLSTALLGERADTEALFEVDLSSDTGVARERLVEALQALAQDPLFKDVLERAVAKVGEVKTETGQRRRGRDSPLSQVGERVRSIADELVRREKDVLETEQIRTQLREANDRVATLAAERDERTRELAATEAAWARASERERLQSQAGELRRRVAAIAGARAELARLEHELAQAQAELPRATEAATAAESAATTASETVHRCREAVERARTGGDHEQLAIERLEHRKSTLQGDISAVDGACERARVVRELVREVETMALQRNERAQTLARAEQELAAAEDARKRAHADERLLDGAERLRSWAEASADVEQAERSATEAGRQRERARELREQAERVRTSLAERSLPPGDVLAGLRTLAHELEVAAAKVGVGLALVADFAKKTTVVVRRDDEADTIEGKRVAVDAERAIALEIRNVGTIEVRGGRADAREAWASLHERWNREGAPLVSEHGSLRALEDASARAEAERGDAEEWLREAETLERLAAGHDAGTEALAERRERLREREAALAGLDRAAIEARMHGLDPSKLRRARADAEAELATATARCTSLASRAQDARAEIARLDERATEWTRRRDDAIREVGGDWRTALSDAQARRESIVRELAHLDDELAGVRAGQAEQVRVAESALVSAQTALEAAERERNASRSGHESLRERIAVAEGALGVLRERPPEDEAALEGELARLAAALAAVEDATISADVVASARAGLDDVERRLDDATSVRLRIEGMLEKVGGAVAREKAAEAEEALAAARRDEHEIELDYAGWELLRDTLREVETQEGRHLGVALGNAIEPRFVELTGGRYGRLELTADLETKGLRAAGDVRAIEALSEGLKEQLATLLRLAIAEQLGSAVVLDDHLAQTDPDRISFFRTLLRTVARDVQILALTCRPEDYVDVAALPGGDGSFRDSDDGFVRAVDLVRVITRAAAVEPES